MATFAPLAALSSVSPLSVLAAMITPAVLISACGTLLVATSSRLGRVIDRVRTLSEVYEELTQAEEPDEDSRKRITLLFTQLDLLTSRGRLLQRTMALLYRAVGIFVGTSICLGAVSVVGAAYAWIPVVLGGIGACFLFYASMLMMIEADLAVKGLYNEMDYLWDKGQAYAPPELLAQYKIKKPFGI